MEKLALKGTGTASFPEALRPGSRPCRSAFSEIYENNTRPHSRERLEVKQPADLDLSETMRRAEQTSAAEALKAAAGDLVRFVQAAPRKGG